MTGKTPAPAFAPETERQAAELAAMRRMLQASRGTFSLSVAICNSPALRDYLIERLRSDYVGIELVQLPEPTEDVYDTVRNTAHDPERSSLFVVNLEESLPSSADERPVLQTLNATRELWKQDYPCPVVLWLPEYAATLLSQHSRDLWAWRSHQFEFVSELTGPAAAMADRSASDLGAAARLDADQKRFRIAELEQRIKDVGDPPPEKLVPLVYVWLRELGYLRYVIGELNDAETTVRKALAIDKKLGRLKQTANDYGFLGVIYETRGDLDKAEQMLRKSLKINKKLGWLEGMARNYGNLGVVYQTRGDVDTAEQLHRKSLEIDEKLGGLEGMATQYGNLGLIYQTRGDVDKAEKLHRKALEIAEKLGRLEGIAHQYAGLGLIYQTRGDLDKAEQMHRRALEIEEKLGWLEGMARQYANIGQTHRTRGDVVTARSLWTKALRLYKQVGIPHMVENVQAQLDSLPDGEEPRSSAR